MNSVLLWGLEIDCFTTESLNAQILQCIRDKKHEFIANVNANAINIACREPRFMETLNAADYIFCDGHGVMLAARIMGENIPEKITYAEWLPKLAVFCDTHKLSMFLIGGQPGVADAAADRLRNLAPTLRITGTHHGYFDMRHNSAENEEVVQLINDKNPDILLVCLGMPMQEYWLSENWHKLQAHVALTGGAALDYVAERLRRPPAWMTKYGFEWLGRMLIEPRRLGKRYLIGNILFAGHVLCERFKRKTKKH